MSSVLAAAFMAVALWLTVLSTLSTRARNDGDRGIDAAAPLVALAQRIPLLLGRQSVGDVGVGRHPAAGAHRPADHRDDAAVVQFGRLGFGAPFGDLFQPLRDIAVHVAAEIPRGKPMQQ